MPARAHLSEEDERQEREDRDHARALEAKIRELRGRRQLVLTQVHQLSDEQKALYDQRGPRQDELERIHAEHRELGRKLSELRRERDRARTELDEGLAKVRIARQELPRGERVRPDQLKREMAQLELRQQTNALPLAEENALIDRLRVLRRQLEASEKTKNSVDEHERKVKELEAALREKRAQFDQLGEAMAAARAERDRRMESMRARLLDVGQLVAQIREKAKVRGEAMARLDAVGRQIGDAERELDMLMRNSRARRQEARKTISEYNRTVREGVSGESAYAKTAEAQLQELLKRGRVTLRG